MSTTKSYQSFSETKRDFKISWDLLKENWKAFISTIIFAAFSLLLVSSITFIIVHFIPNFFTPAYFINSFNIFNRLTFFLTSFVIILLAVLVFFAFLSCQYGLSYDIMSSGDMFAEFKGSFAYFRQHWWQYSLLTILISWRMFFIIGEGTFFRPRIDPLTDFLISLTQNYIDLNFPGRFPFYFRELIGFVIYFIIFVLFINTLTSVTAQGHYKEKTRFSQFTDFKNSLIESFRIFRKYPKRLFTSWGIFFLIFIIPMELLIICSSFFRDPIISPLFLIIVQILFFLFIFIGTPMMTLVATRIFNSVEFEHCSQIKQGITSPPLTKK